MSPVVVPSQIRLESLLKSEGVRVKTKKKKFFFQSQAENSDVETYKTLWNHMKGDPSPMVRSVEEGYSRVSTSTYAFMWDYPVLQYQMQKNCQLMMVLPLLPTIPHPQQTITPSRQYKNITAVVLKFVAPSISQSNLVKPLFEVCLRLGDRNCPLRSSFFTRVYNTLTSMYP